MQSVIIPDVDRADLIDYVASHLLVRAAVLTRLLVNQLGGELSRTEVGLLNTLSGGPRRITELAELERLAQPTMTLLVKRLEQQDLVNRERQADDGRVVLVSLTDAGSLALEDYRARASTALGAYLTEMSDEQVEALAAATETLAELVSHLQQRTTSQKATSSSVQRADPQPTDADADAAQRARDRRYQRAFAGWLASRMRTRAHERQRHGGARDGPQ
jgi:DNA-binding MarR family transcriptional regulator